MTKKKQLLQSVRICSIEDVFHQEFLNAMNPNSADFEKGTEMLGKKVGKQQ